MGSFSITHWIILLVVVVLVFGTQKLKNAGKDLGGAVKGFKDAMKEGESANGTDPKLRDDRAQDRVVQGSAQPVERKDQV